MKNLKLSLLALALLTPSVALFAARAYERPIEEVATVDEDIERSIPTEEGYEPELLTAGALAKYIVDNDIRPAQLKRDDIITDDEIRVIALSMEPFKQHYTGLTNRDLSAAMTNALNERIQALGGLDAIRAEAAKEGKAATAAMPEIGGMFEEKEVATRSMPSVSMGSGYTIANIQAIKLPASKHFTGDQTRSLKKIFNAAMAAGEYNLAKSVMDHLATAQNKGGAVFLDMQREMKKAGK